MHVIPPNSAPPTHTQGAAWKNPRQKPMNNFSPTLVLRTAGMHTLQVHACETYQLRPSTPNVPHGIMTPEIVPQLHAWDNSQPSSPHTIHPDQHASLRYVAATCKKWRQQQHSIGNQVATVCNITAMAIHMVAYQLSSFVVPSRAATRRSCGARHTGAARWRAT
jgi:hypothetical protein